MLSDKRLHVSFSPHISTKRSTASIMLDVIIALLPAVLAGTVIFGLGSLLVILVSVSASVLSEVAFCLITKRKNTAFDLSAAVTGLLLALNLPATVTLWQVALGAVFSTVAVKCLFGGIGQNFANPAIAGRVFMLVCFSGTASAAYPVITDTVSSATPLAELSYGLVPDIGDLLLGLRGGAIGETCAIALVLGFIYLVIKRVVRPFAPISFILTVFLLSLAFEGGDAEAAVAWMLSGGLLLGAFFMATDYSSTPITDLGKVIFGIGAGLITALIRFYGSYPEGVSFAILFMNLLVPCIDRLCIPRPFGGRINERL